MSRLSLLSLQIQYRYLSSGLWAGGNDRSERSFRTCGVVGGPVETNPSLRHATDAGQADWLRERFARP